MFAYFLHSVGVANILDFMDHLEHELNWITEEPDGQYITKMADILLSQ